MQTYVVSRPGIAANAAELDAALMRLRAFEESGPLLQARWMHSYALREAAGGFGLTCVFRADGIRTLERHAVQTEVPAQQILPVTATLLVRPFAPTRVYRVRRSKAWRNAADLDRGAAVARRVVDEDMPQEVSWLRSYVVSEDDGTLGSVCLYQAVDPDALREHARRAGLPADEIVPVVGRVVFRDDPKLQPAHGSAVSA